MAIPIVGLRGGPRFGVLGIAFGANSTAKTGVASLGSTSTVIVVITVNHTVIVGISSRVTLAPVKVLIKNPVVGISSIVTLTPVKVLIKNPIVGISSRVTLAPVTQLIQNPIVGISSRVTLAPVTQLTKNPVVGISSRVTLAPVTQLTKIPIVGISSRVTLASIVIPSYLPTVKFGIVSIQSKVTVNATIVELCPCPSYGHDATLVNAWTSVSCNLDFQSLPYTLPIFRLYMIAQYNFLYKNNATLYNQFAHSADSTGVYNKLMTLTNQFIRKGCE